MPESKDALTRQKAIDRCLSSGRGYTMKQLMKECNNDLLYEGKKPVTSMNTIRADVRSIDERHASARRSGHVNEEGYTIVEVEHKGRNKYYRYWREGFSIYKPELDSKEMAGLIQAVNILKRFQGMPDYEWVDDMADRFRSYTGVSDDASSAVGFDENPDLVGKDHFTHLFNAICSHTPLLITYHNFRRDEDIPQVVHPYYLKQYNKRWFLFGWNELANCITNYAFDRIVSIEDSHNDYIPNTGFDPDDYFDEMIGVSRHMDDESTKVQLWVSPSSWPYIKTKPLHGTQRIVEETPEGATISIDVILNYELEQLILSYGEAVKVISPVSFRDKIKQRVEKLMENYK